MNRIYKFRAWDKKRNCWNFTLFDFDADGEMLTADWFEINQFTGLKDKNNVDVYEGDIVRKLSAKGWRIGSVVFNHGAFIVKYPQLKGWKLLSERGQQAVEVIGNLWENPDLLKG